MTSRRETELAARTRVVLDAAAGHVFGTEPGRLAAELYDVLVRTTDDAGRARVAAALARCWAYGGHADRAASFADEALAHAEQAGDPELIADCLDAVLAAHWGPDELTLREVTAAQLDEVSAHVLDSEARLRGHLWSLQVGWETLRVQVIQSQLRALELLAAESPRARFFAASRRWMYDHVRGVDTSALIEVAEGAAAEAGLADAWMVAKVMRAYTALHAGEADSAAETAELMEQFARSEGVVEVATEAASLWALLGRHDRARALLEQLGPDVLESLPRDLNYLLNLHCVLEAALAVGDEQIVGTATRLLTPYENRAVLNAGAVYFHGVTDDSLARAAAFTGDHARADQLRATALATYRRLGATWWQNRLQSACDPTTPASTETVVHFRPVGDGLWLIGSEARPLRALRGFEYLHRLLAQPGRPVSAIDLVTDGTATVIQPDTGPQLDRQAATAYRHRLSDLAAELAEVADWADLARVESLTAEREALLAELTSAVGLTGRPRATGSTAERARVAATKAIATAIARIESVDPPLATHLRDAIRTGTTCSYRPRPSDHLTWQLSG
ncbi:hypothetical protein EV651_11964 [Kribbella sp. VKM Ac-2571]|uniref:hypothetical protein n=1 Tax=Kribbella sp. VKM Ac-2571 TaxID=2512222 RepID=UPI0010601C88|nr:hypothetical protein [Kribbella sp. VKM Ac-2571]TDO51137.1 hypothetical protein EV651_11964 [Kribbella sp. VKM Ac-2571]